MDKTGNRSRQKAAGETKKEVIYEYDRANRLLAVYQNINGTKADITFDYDVNGNQTTATAPNWALENEFDVQHIPHSEMPNAMRLAQG